jgi:hypothetical protein
VGGLNSQINGTYGYLTLDAHGNAEYHSYPNSVNGRATDTFTYTLRDGDGDQHHDPHHRREQQLHQSGQ